MRCCIANNVKGLKKGNWGISILQQEWSVVFTFCVLWFLGLLLGMCESVRTRNTLHEVGAAKSKIWHNAVVRRKMKKKKKKDKMIKCEM